MTLPIVPADGNTYALWTLATNATALTNVASLPGVTSVGADAVAGTNFGLVSTSVGSSYTLTLTYSTNGGGGGATNASLVNGTPGAVTITGPGVTTNGGGL